jgi:hypothetical protein
MGGLDATAGGGGRFSADARPSSTTPLLSFFVPIAIAAVARASSTNAISGEDLVRAKCNRTHRPPFDTSEGKLDLTRQDPTPIACPYRALQDTMVRFFGDAFEGRAPVVTGFAAPAR